MKLCIGSSSLRACNTAVNEYRVHFKGESTSDHGCSVIHSVSSNSPTHGTQDSVAKTPYFQETISCPALITCESRRSGRNPGLDGQAEKTTIPNEFRESLWGAPRSEIRVHSGLIRYLKETSRLIWPHSRQ